MKENTVQEITSGKFRGMATEEKILWLTQCLDVPEPVATEEALAELIKKAGQPAESKKRTFTAKIRYFAAAAAAILVLLSLWLFTSSGTMRVTAEKGEHLEYIMPDGSSVMLNADSRITFNPSRFNKKRKMYLDGEAFIKAEKGDKFLISTKNADISIVGTSFNVCSRNNYFTLSCIEGKVFVDSRQSSDSVSAGQSIYISGDLVEKKEDKDVLRTAEWRDGKFNFENKSLNFVLDEIERQFNVKFVARGTENRFFTGSFNNGNLTEALDIVCIPMGLSYEIEGKNKIIISPGQ